MEDFFDFLEFQNAMRKTESEKDWYDKATDIVNADNDYFLTTNYIFDVG